jgi:hypothetical protein
MIYFGEINPAIETDYQVPLMEVAGQHFSSDLHFKSPDVSEMILLKLEQLLNQLSELVKTAQEALKVDFDHRGEVFSYLDFHLSELNTAQVAQLVQNSEGQSDLEKLFSVLFLKRVGFYPESDTEFAVLDFTISTDLTQYLLVVKMNSDATINHITMES